MARQVPMLDFRQYQAGGEQRRQFIDLLGGALHDFGFVSIAEHPISPDTFRSAYAAAERVFALNAAQKAAYESKADGRQRGYTPFGIEHAKDRDVADIKEFWQVGRDLGANHPLHQSRAVPPNLFAQEVPESREAFQALFDQLEAFANDLLDGVGSWLELRPGTFRDMVHHSNSVIRVIHYPPLAKPPPDGALRAAPHEDINLMTVLPASTQGGLELLTRDGDWLAVSPPPGVLICDTGDMMALVTANRLPATTHRVVNPSGNDTSKARYSMPFFLHPHPEVVLTPFDGSGHPAIKAKDFLHERLVAIGVA